VPLRQGTPPEASDLQITIDVGRLRWRDLARLHSIQERYLLNQPGRPAAAGQPVAAGLRQLLPLVPSASRVFVARADRRPVGYAVFGVRNPDRRWVLLGLGANLGIYELQPVWEELVNFGIVAAGLEGTKRLYARIPFGSDLSPVIRASGFHPYASEAVLWAPLGALGPATARVRRQHRSDVWAIHQLYMGTVPQPVQYAEALTSHHWDISTRVSASSIQTGWIVESGYQVVAYMRAESRPDTHVLEFMVDPGHGDLFPQLLAGALGDLSGMAPRQVYVLVRGYQQEFLRPLLDRGFAIQLEQDLHVKYTTAMARVPVATFVTFPQEVKEPAGKRVPTFLKGASGDPASESPG
jgi:hypothetical protein